MPPKRHRLTVEAFNRFFALGKRRHGQYCTVVYSPHAKFKAAVVVGKKVYKNAVDRNRLRRQLYPVISQWANTTAQSGIVQCLVKPAAATAPLAEVRADLEALLAGVSNPR